MMWNNRIVSTRDELTGEFLELAEVFYDKDNKPYAYGDANICGDTLYSLTTQLEHFNKALELPILKYPEDFTGDVNK